MGTGVRTNYIATGAQIAIPLQVGYTVLGDKSIYVRGVAGAYTAPTTDPFLALTYRTDAGFGNGAGGYFFSYNNSTALYVPLTIDTLVTYFASSAINKLIITSTGAKFINSEPYCDVGLLDNVNPGIYKPMFVHQTAAPDQTPARIGVQWFVYDETDPDYGLYIANGTTGFANFRRVPTATSTGLNFIDNIKLKGYATGSAPAYVEGGLYYDTTLHKLRVGGAAGWETVTSV